MNGMCEKLYKAAKALVDSLNNDDAFHGGLITRNTNRKNNELHLIITKYEEQKNDEVH